MRILTYNIHHGEGLDGRIDLPRIAAVIAAQRPDLVALQEVDRNARRSGGVDQAAELGRLTGLQADRCDVGAGGTWTVQLIAADNFKNLADGPARADFQQIYSAPAAVTLLPTLYPADLGRNQANVLSLDASAREWLAKQVVDGAPYVVARIVGPTGGKDTLFAWDSGSGPATGGEAPKLTLNLGAAPPTPPPLPTEIVVVVTFTLTPANVMTVAAQAQTATAVATTGVPRLQAIRKAPLSVTSE